MRKSFLSFFYPKSSFKPRARFDACVDKYRSLSTREIDRMISNALVKGNLLFPSSDSKVVLEHNRFWFYDNTSSLLDNFIMVSALWKDKKKRRGLSRRTHFILIERLHGDERKKRMKMVFKVELVKQENER